MRLCRNCRVAYTLLSTYSLLGKKLASNVLKRSRNFAGEFHKDLSDLQSWWMKQLKTRMPKALEIIAKRKVFGKFKFDSTKSWATINWVCVFFCPHPNSDDCGTL